MLAERDRGPSDHHLHHQQQLQHRLDRDRDRLHARERDLLDYGDLNDEELLHERGAYGPDPFAMGGGGGRGGPMVHLDRLDHEHQQQHHHHHRGGEPRDHRELRELRERGGGTLERERDKERERGDRLMERGMAMERGMSDRGTLDPMLEGRRPPAADRGDRPLIHRSGNVVQQLQQQQPVLVLDDAELLRESASRYGPERPVLGGVVAGVSAPLAAAPAAAIGGGGGSGGRSQRDRERDNGEYSPHRGGGNNRRVLNAM